MCQLLPYKDNTNFIVDPSMIQNLESINSLQAETEDDKYNLDEKLYAFACFLPQGKHNTCILNNISEDPTMRTKNIYSTLIRARPRQYKIDLKFKKIKQFKIERKFKKESSIFKDWIEPNYTDIIISDLEYTNINKLIKQGPILQQIEEVLV